jgi:signal transduction histidine kinase
MRAEELAIKAASRRYGRDRNSTGHVTEPLTAETGRELRRLAFFSHDLRNNLQAIDLHLQLLRQQLHQSGTFAYELSLLDRAHEAIALTTDGMQRLLTLEQLRSPQARPRFHLVNLRALADDVAASYLPAARAKGLALSVDLPPAAVVNSDRALIALVLQNLLGNAVKFSARGVIRVAAKRGAGAEAGWVLSVSDQGPGMSPKLLEHMFTAFVRGTAGSEDGVGLGLAIAAKAADVLGAELSVASKRGEGSTFRIRLPDRPDSDDGGDIDSTNQRPEAARTAK